MLGYIFVGLLAGAIAKAILPGKQGGGWIATILLGVAGAFVGGSLGNMLLGGSFSDIWSVGGLVWSVVGSLVILAVYGFLTKNKK